MKSLKNLWVGNPYGDAQSLIIESEDTMDKKVDYQEFWIDLQWLERIANDITLYLKSFKSSNAGENVVERSKAELLRQVECRKGYDLAKEAAYKKRSDGSDTQKKRLELDPNLVVAAQKQKRDEIIYWQAGLELNVLAGFVKFFAMGDTEEEARTALNIKVENFISAICVPSKNEPEPPPTVSAPAPPTPIPSEPVFAQQES